MKEGLKKFLGVMTVYGILGWSAGIGASAYEFNAVPVGSVPGMTDEEVKEMNLMAEFALFLNEMVSTDDCSQWDENISEAQKLFINIKKFKTSKHIEWEGNYRKHENWRRVNPVVTKISRKDFNVSHDTEVRLKEWFEKNIAPIL